MSGTTGNLDTSSVGKIQVNMNAGDGWVDVGYIAESTVRWNGNTIDHNYQQAYPFGCDFVIMGKVDLEVEFTWEAICDWYMWHRVLHGGTITTDTASTTAVTDEAVVLSGVYWTDLLCGYTHASEKKVGDFKYDCTVTVTSAAGGGTTYTIDVDYYLDRKTGAIARTAGSTILTGATVYVDYTYNTYAGKSWEPFDSATLTSCKVRFTKPLLAGTILEIIHDAATFSGEGEFNPSPGDTGALATQTNKIMFMKDTAASPRYGAHGRFRIYTP